MFAPTNKCADRCRGGIKNIDPIFLDDFPKPVRLRPIRRPFIHDSGGTVGEWTIDNVAVARDPADIRCAPEDILISNIEDVLRGRINADQIAACRVEDAFWFTSGATCIEQIKRMLAVE